jgi:hypothetical protein
MKTEKISVNLSPVELGQIVCLVERGLFDSRSEFMRTAARKVIETHAADIQQFLEPEYLKSESTGLAFLIGVGALTKDEMSNYITKGKKIHIRAIGIYNISKHITPEEIKQVVLSCKVYGKLIASSEIRDVLREIED